MLKRKKLVVTRKIMSRQISEVEGNEKLVAKTFSVVTQEIYVATRTRLLNKNSVTTLSKSITTESKKSTENRSRQKTASYDRGQRQRLKTLS